MHLTASLWNAGSNAQLPSSTAARHASQNSEPFPGVSGIGLDSTWSAGDLQDLNRGAGTSRPSGPVITTGALPVASDQPSNFLTDLPQPEPNAWSDRFSAPTQQTQQQQRFPPSSMEQYPGFSHQLQYQPAYTSAQPGRADSHPEDSDALLKQVEEILKGDKSPSVQACLRALVAAQGNADGSQTPRRQLHTPYSHPPANQANAAPSDLAFSASADPSTAPYSSSFPGPYQSGLDSMHNRPAIRQSLQPPVSQLPPPRSAAPSRGLQSIADSTQPQMMSRGTESFAWPSSNQSAIQADLSRRQTQQQGLQSTTADPALSQAFQSMSGRHPQLPQQLPQQLPADVFQLPDTLLAQDLRRKPGPQSSTMQAHRSEEQTRQTGARSLQQQAQARLPRQEAPKQIGTGSYPSSASGFPQPLPVGGAAKGPTGLSPGMFDTWGLPIDSPSQRPDLQQHSQGSNTGPDSSFNGLTSPFADVPGSQSMTQSLMDPIPFSSLPSVDAAPFDLPAAQYRNRQQQPAAPGPTTAPLPAAVGRLPAPHSAFSSAPAAPTAGSSRKEPVNGILPIAFEPLPLRPAAPQRAPPPEDRAAAARNLVGHNAPVAQAAVASPDIHPMFQGNRQDSSDASCGFAPSGGYTSRLPNLNEQVGSASPLL